MSITDWPEAQRPREKLIRLGARSLTDAELLAVFLRVGVKGKVPSSWVMIFSNNLAHCKICFPRPWKIF